MPLIDYINKKWCKKCEASRDKKSHRCECGNILRTKPRTKKVAKKRY